MAIATRDTMTDTNWRDLHLHTGEIGATWTRHPSTPSSRWYLFGNRVHCGVIGALYASGVPASADYTVDCDYTIFSDIASIAICGRVSTTADTMYYVYYLGAELVLVKRVAGERTTLGAWVSTLSGGGTTYQLQLSMVGTAIKVFLNGVERISVIDSGITVAGRGGVRSAGANDAGTGKHIDNFTVTDTSTAAATTRGYSYVIGC